MTSAAFSRLLSALFHTLRSVFRAVPISDGIRDRLRQQFLDRFPAIRPTKAHGMSATSLPRRAYVHSGGRALGYVEHRIEALPDPLPAALVAFYLPQFHTIPENDEWWGKGFTEWRNVARALPQFEGHAQPRLPGDLGFYDLRNPQVMRQQAKLAREYGISAFCFYFYWFSGKTLLEAPLQQWLEDTSINMPFCLCWANENWSRRWDGRAEDILIGQSHSPEDDIAFIDHIARYLRDPRYVRIDGKPLLLVYRPGLLPDPQATADRWRTWCREDGIGEIHLAYTQAFERPDPRSLGFDAAVEFPPNLSTPGNITSQQRVLNAEYAGDVLDWRELAGDYRRRGMPEYPLFPGVNCGWDNEPRRPQRGRTFLHASPSRYRAWLNDTIDKRLAGVPTSERFVFLNAWNEWAEGAVLEPDSRLGHAWLQATRGALHDASRAASRAPCKPCAVVHAWHTELLPEILQAIQESKVAFRVVVTAASEKAGTVSKLVSRTGIEAELLTFENRGRDILPFLGALQHLAHDKDDLIILKLHTKRSEHLDTGDQWRREMIDSLLAHGQAIAALDAFANDPELGILAPRGHLLNLDDYWGDNRPMIRHLAGLLGIPEPEGGARFVSGSMFWARMAALEPLLDSTIDLWNFEPEKGQLDGTAAHAIERMFAVFAEHAGYRVTQTGAPTRRTVAPERYPYARRSR
jgi:lipopolysaccharide biosynthesis protein